MDTTNLDYWHPVDPSAKRGKNGDHRLPSSSIVNNVLLYSFYFIHNVSFDLICAGLSYLDHAISCLRECVSLVFLCKG